MIPFLSGLTTLKKLPVWLALATAVSIFYLGVAWLGYGYVGFPLDDAWIHQTYARNLGEAGEFAFTPGQPSTGSTAPLWSILLSLGYWLNIPFRLWTYGLGIICLGLSGWLMARLGRHLFTKTPWVGSLVGLSLIAEWHLVWAAVSGMETILFITLSIFVLMYYFQDSGFRIQDSGEVERVASKGDDEEDGVEEQEKTGYKRQLGACFGLGLMGGLLMLVRPEGVGLIGLIGLHMGLVSWQKSPRQLSRLLIQWLIIGVGLVLPLLPYFLFNLAQSGQPLPNTFYAKQQEYAILVSQLNVIERWWGVFTPTIIGGQALLLPGLLWSGYRIIKQKNWGLALIFLWWLSFLTLYALRLPVTYQHGRYQMPTIPWLLLLGIWGSTYLFHFRHRTLWIRVGSKVWSISVGVALFLFIVVGANSYANDVTFIETEMVLTSHWLRDNTPPESIIAAHDIGAIGYFTQRPLVDLAGLITPAVIPFIRDETALLAFARAENATYLVTFPSWYPLITTQIPQVYSTNSSWAIAHNYDNMAVYQLHKK